MPYEFYNFEIKCKIKNGEFKCLLSVQFNKSNIFRKAKELVNQVINSRDGVVDIPPMMRNSGPMQVGEVTIEISVPGPKVGLIIGKGGETIRQLQEKAQVKMVSINLWFYLLSTEGPGQRCLKSE